MFIYPASQLVPRPCGMLGPVAEPFRFSGEADLDYACGKRGRKRLVFSDDDLHYVTVDLCAARRDVRITKT
ncbi:MAG: hypothetical protein FJY37_17005 [Betaproteobacteria bacterium]|nr:hypothetical protein [Betaproteobacteria bacterium]